MGFPRQEYCSGLTFPSPGDLPKPGIEPVFPAWQMDSLPLKHQGRYRDNWSRSWLSVFFLWSSWYLITRDVQNMPVSWSINSDALFRFPYFAKLYWPWSLEGLGTGGEGDDKGWDGWMASPTQWTWVWVNSRSWWWTGRPGMLQFVESQRVRHNWVTELNWTELILPGSPSIADLAWKSVSLVHHPSLPFLLHVTSWL